MVETIGVRGPTLARLAMVLVLLSIGHTPALRVIPNRGELALPWTCEDPEFLSTFLYVFNDLLYC